MPLKGSLEFQQSCWLKGSGTEAEFAETTDRDVPRLVVLIASFFVVLKVVYISLIRRVY